jgi:hypothetical protein
MMATRTLAPAEWNDYFSNAEGRIRGRSVHIEVVGSRLGDQTLVRSAPLMGITYETRSDTLAIILQGLDHMIEKPKAISVEEDDGTPVALEIVDSEDRHQIITLTSP